LDCDYTIQELKIMSKKVLYLQCVFLLVMISFLHPASYEKPRMGIVISTAMIQDRWMNSQMGAHGWAAVANLAGIPYDCLYLTDLTAKAHSINYDVLVITQAAYADKQIYPDLVLLSGNIWLEAER